MRSLSKYDNFSEGQCTLHVMLLSEKPPKYKSYSEGLPKSKMFLSEGASKCMGFSGGPPKCICFREEASKCF